MRVDGVYGEFDVLLATAVRDGRQLNDGVKRNVQIGQFLCNGLLVIIP